MALDVKVNDDLMLQIRDYAAKQWSGLITGYVKHLQLYKIWYINFLKAVNLEIP